MTKTVQDVIDKARSTATTLIERRQSARLPDLEEMEAFGNSLGDLIALTERLDQALKPVEEALLNVEELVERAKAGGRNEDMDLYTWATRAQGALRLALHRLRPE